MVIPQLRLVVGRTCATKERLLDAAEALFMEHGFEATSLRLITATAGANLAAANYHFGSKEAMFEAVLTRRLDPMNQERVELLDRFEAEARRPRRSPAIASLPRCSFPRCGWRAILRCGGNNFLRLLGRAYADPAPFIRRFLPISTRHDRPLQDTDRSERTDG